MAHKTVFGIIIGPLVYMNVSCKCSKPYFSLLMYEHNLMIFDIIDICVLSSFLTYKRYLVACAFLIKEKMDY